MIVTCLLDVVNPGQILFKPGDKVRVNLALDNFKRLQEDNADGWKDSMKEVSTCLKGLDALLWPFQSIQSNVKLLYLELDGAV